MTKYTTQRRATSKRSLSRRPRMILLASLLTPTVLLAIANVPASAAAKFATLQEVQDAINTALAPIQSAIANLQTTQATHTSQITDLQTQQTSQAQQISNLQGSTGKSLKAFDANGQELGIALDNCTGGCHIYSPTLQRFISFDFALSFSGSTIDGQFLSTNAVNPNIILEKIP